MSFRKNSIEATPHRSGVEDNSKSAVSHSKTLSVGQIAGLAIGGLTVLILGGLICGKVGAFSKIPNNLHYLGIIGCVIGATSEGMAYAATKPYQEAIKEHRAIRQQAEREAQREAHWRKYGSSIRAKFDP